MLETGKHPDVVHNYPFFSKSTLNGDRQSEHYLKCPQNPK